MDEVTVMIGGCLIFACLLFGGLFYSDHLSHVEKMECMKQKGEYIKGTCVFRDGKTQ